MRAATGTGRALIGLSALLLSACGGGSLVQAPVEISEPYQFGEIPEELWSFRGEAWAQDTDLVLTADDERLYVPGRRTLSALAIEDGTRLWMTETDEVSGGLQADDDYLFASLFNGDTLALLKEDGSVLWSTFVAGEVLSPAARTSRWLFIRTNNGRLVAIDIAEGEIEWVVENATSTLSLRGTSAPTVLRGRVFQVDDNCKAQMLSNSDGNIIWERVLAVPEGGNEIERLIDGDSQPLLLGEKAYVACYNSGIMEIETTTGQPGWRADVSTRHDMLLASARIIAIEESDSTVVALDVVSGRPEWERTDLAYRRLSNPVRWRKSIWIGDHEGYIHRLDPDDGEIVGRFRPFRVRVRSMLVADDRLYAVDDKGHLKAFHLPGP